MKAKEAADKAVAMMRQLMAQCFGEDEATTLRTFIDAVGSEVDGLEMRLDEIEEDAPRLRRNKRKAVEG